MGVLLSLVLFFQIGSSSAWGSSAPTVTPPPPAASRIAVLPWDNLSGAAAPLREMRASLVQALTGQGVELLDDGAQEQFLSRHRVRYTGGVDTEMATALRTEEGVAAVLVVNLELYNEESPPRMALLARLVEASPNPTILWMEPIALAGHENPGIFEMGLVLDPLVLREKVIRRLAAEITRHLGQTAAAGRKADEPRAFPPRIAFGREKEADKDRPMVAVLPFFNESTRRYANEILLLHFVLQLHASGRYRPVEPGLIRDKMLAMRIIMKDGISLSQADLIANNLETDYVLTGRVYDYQDVEGAAAIPSVDFSAQLMERFSKRIIWTSKSYNKGDEEVWFYDWRRIYTASRLASGMVRGVVQRLDSLLTPTSGEIGSKERRLP